MSTPSDQHSEPTEDQLTDAPGPDGATSGRWKRVLVWSLTMVGLLGYLGVGSVSAVSYRYSSFLQQTFREVERRGVVDIWSEQVGDLPSSDWLMTAAFTAAIFVAIASFVYGAWLLLVASRDEAAGDFLRPGMPRQRA